MYGEKTEKGPNGVYAGGLWVRTSMNVPMQQADETELRDGLMRYDRGKRGRDSGLSVDLSKDLARLRHADRIERRSASGASPGTVGQNDRLRLGAVLALG